MSSNNPLLLPSQLQYEAPNFDLIKAEHFAPAIDAGMAEQLKEIDDIVHHTFVHADDTCANVNKEDQSQLQETAEVMHDKTTYAKGKNAANFENTVEKLELSGQLLWRAKTTLLNLCAANTSTELQAIEQEYAPRFAQHYDAIYMNRALYERVHAVYLSREVLKNNEQIKLTEYHERQFALAGAGLCDEAKSELCTVNERIATLQTEFGQRLLRGREKSAIIIHDVSELSGLTESEVALAKAAGNTLMAQDHDHDHNNKKNNSSNKYALTLTNTTQQPLFTQLHDEETRHRLYSASIHRNELHDCNDTSGLLQELVRLRLRKAQLLGLNCFAEWKLQNEMATVVTAQEMLKKIASAAIKKAESEKLEIEEYIKSKQQQKHNSNSTNDHNNNSFEKKDLLKPWDWVYFQEKVREEKYHLDESELAPYLELHNVIEKGVFYAAHELYGITLHRRPDLPIYHNDVLAYEVFDQNNKSFALFFLDPYARPNKRGGAWMTNYVRQSHMLNQKPVVFNVLNIPKPAIDSEPTLLEFRNVITLFHEFGHALHGMLSNVRYPSLSGTSVARDFLEFPSQINEKWATYDKVLKHYALHYKTGECMPDALITLTKNASVFNGGFETVELVKAAAIDFYWHTITSDAECLPPAKMESAAEKEYGLSTIPLIPARYLSTYFAHIFQGGYASGYYSYLWAKLLDCDGFEWLLDHGGLTRENGEHLRQSVLEVGATFDANELYMRFANRKPDINAYFRSRGLIV